MVDAARVAGTDRDRGRAPAAAALVALTAAGCLIVAHAARQLTFSGDDWIFITQRRGFSAGVFFKPHGEHLSAIPIAAYKLLLATFGASSYVPFMALLLIVHAINCVLLYLLARRYVGPWAALIPSAILAVLGPAWQDLLWAFQVGFFGSVASGLGMALCLEAPRPRRDRAASALLGVSLLCSSIGLAMIVLGGLRIVLDTPRKLKRLWVIAVPVALYIVWYAIYGVTTIKTSNIVHIPKYVGRALAAAIDSVLGLGQTHTSPFLVSIAIGRYLAVLLVIALIVYLVRGGRPRPLSWAAIGAALALWVAECLEYTVPGRSAPQSRYQYTAAALLMLAVIAIRQWRRPVRISGALLAAAVVAICVSNTAMLYQRSHFTTNNSDYVYAETGAIQIARATVAPGFTTENGLTVPLIGNHAVAVFAGPYLSAVRAFGSAADTPQGIMRRPEKIREAVDLVLSGAERLALMTFNGAPPPSSSCHSAATGAGLGVLTVPPGTLTVRVRRGTVAQLELRRFAARFKFVSTGNVPAVFGLPRLEDGRTLAVHVPRDTTTLPWRARVVGGQIVTVCIEPFRSS
jgi:hypothetical protein